MKLNRDFWNHPLSNYSLQFIFIFSSVYFAFWLTSYNDTRKLRQVEKLGITAIYRELSQNLEGLKADAPYHSVLRDKLEGINDSLLNRLIHVRDQTAYDVLQKMLRPNNALGSARLSSTAWETFQSTEAFVLMDYALASDLAILYQLQREGVQTTTLRLQDLFLGAELFQSEHTPVKINQLFWTFREVSSQEEYLIRLIGEMLTELEAAYPHLK